MIRDLLKKTFIPVSRINDNEDDIFIFTSRGVREHLCRGAHFKNPFFEKNIDTFFNYVNLNLCNFFNGGGHYVAKARGATK